MSRPVPIAEGTLRTTPFAHLLVSAEKKRLTGTLALWPDDSRPGQDRLRFVDGAIVAARLLEPAATLDRALLPLFSRVGAFAIFDEDFVSDGPEVLRGEVATPALLAAGLRGGLRDDIVDGVFAKFGATPVRVSPSADTRAFSLLPKELEALEVLSSTSGGILHRLESSADPKVMKRVLYLLAITSKLEREHSQSGEVARPSLPSARNSDLPTLDSVRPAPTQSLEPPPSRPAMPRPDRRKTQAFASPEAPPLPPPGLSPELASRWDELVHRVVQADNQNYFEILGISRSDGAAETRTAYFELAKRVHPDRLPSEFAPLRPFVERYFHQLTDARESLEEDEKRVAHVRDIQNGGGTPASDRKLMGALAAAHELEKAHVLANMHRWPELLETLELARELDPSQVDIYALEAWALFHQLGRERAATTEAILALTERVLTDPNGATHERASYTRALTLKRLGRDQEALELLKRLLERNPRHLEAAREVRLFEMRARDAGKQPSAITTKAPDSSGFLSKLFGKKD